MTPAEIKAELDELRTLLKEKACLFGAYQLRVFRRRRKKLKAMLTNCTSKKQQAHGTKQQLTLRY